MLRGGGGLGYCGEPPNSLAIELDASFNSDLEDIDTNHIGLDLAGSTVSTASQSLIGMVTVPDMALKRVWIDYDATSMILAARINYDQTTKPLAAVLNQTVDMCQVLGHKDITPFYVGFSASTGLCFGRHDVISWTWTHAGSILSGGTRHANRSALISVSILVSFIFQIGQSKGP